MLFSLPSDTKEAAKIEKLREYDEKRKERILNPRNRLIGIDKAALEIQIAEKETRKEEERVRDEAFRLQLLKDSEVAARLEKEVQNAKRKLNEELNHFRTVFQRKEDRREYDLNDPDYLKKSLPGRVLDDDPRLSISGAQKFEGEDTDIKARKKYQTDQQKMWLEQQINERMKLEKEKKLAEDTYNEMIAARDQRAKQLESLEADCKKQLEEATARFNQALAAEQVTQRKLQEMRDLEDKSTEIYNAITGDFLTENPDVAISCLGSCRIVGSSYKGMSPEKKEAFNKEVLRQIKENEARREEQKKRDSDWALMANNFAHEASMNDCTMAAKRREINRRILEENKLLSAEQKRARELSDRLQKCTSTASEEFFNQFNKTAR